MNASVHILEAVPVATWMAVRHDVAVASRVCPSHPNVSTSLGELDIQMFYVTQKST